MWDRRTFLRQAGIGFVASLMPQTAFALEQTSSLFASAARDATGQFVMALLDERGDILHSIPLPSRGHDVTQCPATGRVVAFARRPGVVAMVFDPRSGETLPFSTPADRHFYGHGQFSADGKLLYTTENDFEAARGVIGIYDATNAFARIGEWDSGGVGPHDMVLSADGAWLCVANGGIETHPDFGRQKLNLATMKPNICWLHLSDGRIRHIADLPQEFHQLSTRHLALGANDEVFFGAQDQGATNVDRPLVGRVHHDEGLSWLDLDATYLADLKGYVGSVAYNATSQSVAISSPVGNIALVLSRTGQVQQKLDRAAICGLAAGSGGFQYSTGTGLFGRTDESLSGNQAEIQFDNHLYRMRR